MVSFILCLLPALLATSAQAAAPTCNTCSSTDKSCTLPPGTCLPATTTAGCITVVEDITLAGGEKTTGFFKGCADGYNSGIKTSLTITVGKDKYLRTNTMFCNTGNNCNPATMDVPKGSTTVNGRQCPTCFTLNSDTCDGLDTPCTGAETYCIDFVGEKGSSPDTSKFAAKGCATESVKDITDGATLVSAVYPFKFIKVTASLAKETPSTTKPTTATTSGASPALGRFSFALYLPGLTGLLLVKLLS